ncbi:MAG: inositol monophosphatase family protein [Cyanobacteria bacterium]|nr:inositol monophosphatase family protein [Cyanobacteriota bacterium]
MSPVSKDQNAAIQAVLLDCGQQAQAAAAQPFEVFEKGFEDYVTSVDRALDTQLAQAFSRQFPADGVVTEENRCSAAAFSCTQHHPNRRLWLIDPIDGTEDFIHHGQYYSLMVGLLAQGTPQAGWIYGPAQERFYWGGPDWGLFQLGQGGEALPLTPSAPPDAGGDHCPIILGDRDERRFGRAIAAAVPQLQSYALGSYGLKVMEVIKGQAGLYIYLNGRVKLWDTTGPLALAQAAGLVCCDLDGEPIRFDSTGVYPHSLIHRQPIVVGWPSYVDRFLAPIRQTVLTVRAAELGI